MKVSGLAFTTLLSIGALHAQLAPTNDELIGDWKLSKEFTLAVVEAMPVEKYGFKVDPGEMSFAAMALHIAGSQAFRVAQVAGIESPVAMPKELPKERARQIVLDALSQSFDFCIAQLAKLTPEQLAKTFKTDWFERQEATGRQIVLAMLIHTAHHRAQLEVYLRANGIKPPVYRF